MEQGGVCSWGIVSSSRSFSVYLSVGRVLSAVGIDGGIPKHGCLESISQSTIPYYMDDIQNNLSGWGVL